MSTVAETLDFSTIVTSITPAYRGRFAPTPSGPLHLGSLFTALASWLAARQAGGQWLLRIDDLDRPRCVAGAEDMILHQLDAHGLHWHGAIVRQGEHEAAYRAALQQLVQQGLLYACTCTRATLAATSLAGPDGPVYAGTCRTHTAAAANTSTALRLRLPDGALQWQDGVQGLVQRTLPQDAGDCVLRRADGQCGYHLACALDEVRMGITEVVRGADLLGATVHQQALLQALALPPPRYAHVPVLLAADGRKLSKQNGAAALETSAAAVSQQLLFCLHAMRLGPPAELIGANAETILQWAVPAWDAQRLAQGTTLPATP
ncbi:MAG: tRNA glutamyl-Q(34) synthetase GluQRS [Pseudomonadota bacterium]